MKRSSLLTLFITGALLTACFGVSTHVKSQVTTVSKGKQLIDLKKAIDEGAMSRDDKTKKAKILGFLSSLQTKG